MMMVLATKAWKRTALFSHGRQFCILLQATTTTPYQFASQNHERSRIKQQRLYHATAKREILPLVAGIGVLVLGHYSYRALRRMDEEWKEYEWELQQYEKKHGVVAKDASRPFPDGTVGIDVGTLYLKLARDRLIMENREGQRFTFAGIIHSNDDAPLLGQQAFDKFYNRAVMGYEDTSQLPTIVKAALEDALERSNADLKKIRPVLAVPPLLWDEYTTAFDKNNDLMAVAIPEPVAAIWGAQVQKVLDQDIETRPILVIDVGAQVTQLSVVQRNVVLTTTCLDFGGNLYVDALVNHVINDHAEFALLKNDDMAKQRLYGAAHVAVKELNNASHVELNLPYIGMDLKTREPQHLNIRIAKSLVEQVVTDKILELVSTNGKNFDKLSHHLPPPTSLSSVWMSVLTQILEVTQMTPHNLAHVLVVGGGAKHPLMETSISDCLQSLLGQNDKIMVVPPERSEVTAVGASSLLPTYDYHATEGLTRRQET